MMAHNPLMRATPIRCPATPPLLPTCSALSGAAKEKAMGSAIRRVMRTNARKAPTCRDAEPKARQQQGNDRGRLDVGSAGRQLALGWQQQRVGQQHAGKVVVVAEALDQQT